LQIYSLQYYTIPAYANRKSENDSTVHTATSAVELTWSTFLSRFYLLITLLPGSWSSSQHSCGGHRRTL